MLPESESLAQKMSMLCSATQARSEFFFPSLSSLLLMKPQQLRSAKVRL
jgi:hypothetical protein